jgi:hypothetical protein
LELINSVITPTNFLPLLYDRGKLTDALSLLSQNILSAGRFDDDFSADGGNSYFDTSVTILSKLTRQKLQEIVDRTSSGRFL